jgi:type VI secretion system protein ImpK
MDRVIEATEAVFNGLAQIQRMDSNSALLPELVYQQFSTYVEQAARAATRMGFSQSDADDIRFALVALTDESILKKGGPLRDYWLPRPLQLRYFNENVAGEAFFSRLASIRRDTTRSDVLRVYYLCLLFGFRGQFAVRGGQTELEEIIEKVRDELVRCKAIASDVPLSPHGARPYESIADARRNSLLIWISVASATASVIVYLWFKLSLGSHTSQLVERMASLTGA